MVDPKLQGKVQSRLRSTLAEAEELVVGVTEKVVQKTTLLRESILSKCACNGGCKAKPSTPPTL